MIATRQAVATEDEFVVRLDGLPVAQHAG